MVALIAVVIIGAVGLLGDSLNALFDGDRHGSTLVHRLIARRGRRRAGGAGLSLSSPKVTPRMTA